MNNVLAIGGVVMREMIRRKDFYVLFVLTALLVLLMGAVNVFDDERIARYLKEFCLLLIWISALVIAVTTAARQIPAERESRTIFPLLAKPVTRSELLLGKFAGCWFSSGLCLVAFYLFFTVLAVAREHELPVLSCLQALTAHWIMLGVVIAMTLLGSLLFAAPSSNATISLVVVFGILLVGRHLNKLAAGMAEPGGSILYALYFLLPHLELFDVRELLIHNHAPYGFGVWLLQTLYGLGYAAIFLMAGCLVFRKQSLN